MQTQTRGHARRGPDGEAAMTAQDRRDAAALLVMRLGLAWFMFLWAAHKIIAPEQYRSLARNFDGVSLSIWQIYLVGGLQIALCLLAVLGLFRYASYGALAIMHFYTITRRWERFFDPFEVNAKGFPVNRNVVIDLAVMGAFVALLLLIARDHWSVGGWLRRRNGPRWWQ
ncbi:MAG: hypothetical protein HKN30_17320 [Sulfitobacter sp.]|nr:hypothetical protein [Sulfitobacter sp.]